MKQPGLTVIHAAAVRDAAGINARPGIVVVRDGVVQYAGDPDGVGTDTLEQAQAIDRRGGLVIPGMVNAHTHLELTTIGPRPYDPAGGFVGWAMMLRSHWPDDSGQGVLPDDGWFVRATRRGAQLSRQAGVQAVGDISRFASVAAACREAGLDGQSYQETFGLGPPFDQAGLELIAQGQGGVQPHAPYSAGPSLFDAAARSGRPVSCHLAETRDEHDFVARLEGPFFDFLRAIGKWDDAFAAHYGKGLSPVQWMRPYLEAAANDGGWLAAHCNYVSDDDIAILVDTNTSVAYCPIASEYFGHHREGPGHRYREMLDAGINVCLGTDSIVCAKKDDPQPLGLLSAMRRLYQRDQTDPNTLLAMATVNGARALRMDGKSATLQPGAPARFACLAIDPHSAIDPLVQVLTGQDPAEAISFEK